jgi:electron transfer flavoprotein alpha subunit
MNAHLRAVWTIAEQADGRLRPISYELLAWGRRLVGKMPCGTELCTVVLGGAIDRGDVQRLIACGAEKVYLAESLALTHFDPQTYTRALEGLVRERTPEVVIAGATTTGRTLMPYLAVRLHTGLTADCTGLDYDSTGHNLIQTRPAIGGNILATIITARHRPQMATVRPRSIPTPTPDKRRKGTIIPFAASATGVRPGVEWLGFTPGEQDDANIQEAEKVVAGGRGLKKATNFDLVRQLADQLGAAVAASRDAVDRGWVTYPHQVGLTGKTVAPRLYFAVGISGAIQHLAGMKTAECIVAVNNDPQAQIFQVADFGIVGDLFELLPALLKELERRHGTGGTSA